MFRRMTPDRYLSDAELEAFMAAVRERRHKHQPRDHALFALLANTGIRPSEALGLTRGDVHLSAKPPWIRVARLKKRVQTNDDLVLTDALAVILKKHAQGMDGDGLFNLTRRQAQRLFHYYARVAGIKRKAHLYILRHTAGTRIYRATRDVKLVQALLGHESADTSAIYAHIPRALLLEHALTFPTSV